MKLALALFVSFLVVGCSIRVPYFEPLKPQYVCGGKPSPHCQPTSSRNFSKVDSLDYDGNPGNYLGRSYTNFFERTTCVAQRVTLDDIVESGHHTVIGTLQNESKTDFSNRLSADIVALLRINGVQVPSGLESDINSQVSREIANSEHSEVSLEYKRIDLSNEFIDDHLAACLETTSSDAKVSTGVSVITVSGSWTADRATRTLAAVEAEASYSILSDEIKVSYENAKERALRGEFKPVSFVFAVAYRQGLKR